MKKQFLTLATLAFIGLSNLVNAQAPNWLWAQSDGPYGTDVAGPVTSDAAGNLIVAGTFTSPLIILGTDTFNNVYIGRSDIFIVKYDAAGAILWAKSAGGTDYDYATSVTSDSSGNIIVAGWFQSPTITFGTTTLINAGAYNMFVVKYDASGAVLWAKSAEVSTGGRAYSVTTDAAGNLIVAGYFVGSTITFDTDTLTNVGSGYSDMFIVKYDASGTVLWAKSAGGSRADNASSVTADASGNLMVAGYFGSATIIFGATTLTNVDSVSFDIFIVKYDASGTVIWAKSAGGSNEDNATSVTTDASGNLMVAGDFYSPTIIFGATTLTNAGSGSADMFIVKYDATGTVLWAKSGGGTGYEYASSVAVDASGNLIESGFFLSTTINFGTTTLTNASSGSADMFIVKYDPTGTVLWAKSAGGNSEDYAFSITTDDWGYLIVAGSLQSTTTTFGNTTLISSPGYNRMFIAKLDTAMTTGMGELQDGGTFIVAPNPFTTETTISFSKEQKHTTLKIFNVLGKEIKVINLTSNQFILNKGELQEGIYFVQATDEKKNVASRKIVIQ